MIRAMYSFFVGLGVIGWFALFIIWALTLIGWVGNIYNLISNLLNHNSVWFNDHIALIIAQVLGVVYAPVGAILFWFF